MVVVTITVVVTVIIMEVVKDNGKAKAHNLNVSLVKLRRLAKAKNMVNILKNKRLRGELHTVVTVAVIIIIIKVKINKVDNHNNVLFVKLLQHKEATARNMVNTLPNK